MPTSSGSSCGQGLCADTGKAGIGGGILAVPGRVAQRESARFTRGRSLVRSQPRPSRTVSLHANLWLHANLLVARVRCVSDLVDLEPVKGRRLVCGFIGPTSGGGSRPALLSDVSLCGYSGGAGTHPAGPGGRSARRPISARSSSRKRAQSARRSSETNSPGGSDSGLGALSGCCLGSRNHFPLTVWKMWIT
jgi:hypothetical protein